MNINRFFLMLLTPTLLSAETFAYDCSSHTPFTPVRFQKAHVFVGRFFWKESGHDKEEVVEEVCSTPSPISVPVLDIRGREEEWFHCNDQTVEITCATEFQSKPAVIAVYPSIVFRRWGSGSAQDLHFHAYMDPESDVSRRTDIFARSIAEDLNPKSQVLDAAGGGRGPNSGYDSFYIRVDFEK